MIVSAMNASPNCRILVTPLNCAPRLSAFKEQGNEKYYVFLVSQFQKSELVSRLLVKQSSTAVQNCNLSYENLTVNTFTHLVIVL